MGCVPLGTAENQDKEEPLTSSSTPQEIKISNISDIKINESLFINESNSDPFDFYNRIIKMGEGTYGQVLKVRNKITEVGRAMKIINKEKIKIGSAEEVKLIQEINIGKTLDHPGIMKIYEYYNTSTTLSIITELCTGGEGFNKIVQKRKFDEKMTAHIMNQGLSVVECCHKKGIVHRDLKPENILIETEEQAKLDYFNIKVIDFGTGDIIPKGAKIKTKIGTPYYIAPEILSDQPYDFKCDLWSCGIIMYIMLSGYQPFSGNSNKELFFNIGNRPVNFARKEWTNISREAKELITNLGNKNPLKRFNARRALDSEWIKKNTKKQELSSIPKDAVEAVIKNIKSFSANQKLQQATLAYIVHNYLDNNDGDIIKNIFNQFDSNNDGLLTKDDLLKGLSGFMSEEEATEETNRVMEIIDADKNGFIEYEEFIRAGIDKKKILTKKNIQGVFMIFDKDKNGQISQDEIKSIGGKEGTFDKDVGDTLIKDIDLNGDGQISYTEFEKMMNKLLT